MVLLRATQKMLKLLPESVSGNAASTTALGDWYVNRIVVSRRPLLLLVSSKSLLTIVIPARDAKALPKRLTSIVEGRLTRLGIRQSAVALEIDALTEVKVAKTDDRSVLGQMVDFAKLIPFYLSETDWNEEDLRIVEDRLAETPCRSGGRFEDVIFPRETTIRLLESKWFSTTVH